jgi:hypothetical protein
VRVSSLVPGASPTSGIPILTILEIVWEHLEGWIDDGVKVAHCSLDARVSKSQSGLVAGVVVLARFLDEAIGSEVPQDAANKQRVCSSWASKCVDTQGSAAFSESLEDAQIATNFDHCYLATLS